MLQLKPGTADTRVRALPARRPSLSAGRAAAAITVASLFALLLIPILIEEHTASLRWSIASEVDPARTYAEDLELAMARETSTIRGFLLTGREEFRVRLDERQEEAERALAGLDSLAPALGPHFAEHLATARAERREWLAIYEPLLNGNRSREELVAEIEEQRDRYEDAVQAVQTLASSIDAVAGGYLDEIRSAERTGNVLTIVLAFLTLLSASLVMWFAWRLHRLVIVEQEARTAAEGAVRMRDEVLAIVSHDLRSPLASITLGARILSDDLPPDKRAKSAKMIERSAARMNRLIQDLLDVTRMEQGKGLAVHPMPTDLVPLLRSVLAEFAGQSEAKGILLTLDVPVSLPPVNLDPDRFAQALTNLVSNAVKFTPEGGRVHVGATAARGEIELTVEDTGPGFTREDFERVFEPFWQAGRTAHLGTGLGLPITRGIVEAHGGRIRVESEPGMGARFFITLPVSPS